MKLKAWFTIFELMIVVILISILFFSLENFFRFEGREKILAEWCVNHINWEVSNFFSWVSSWKGIYTWADSNMVYPDTYHMSFSWDNNLIEFWYFDEDWLNIYNELYFTWTDMLDNNCYSDSYHVWLSWDLSLSLNRMFRWWMNEPSFTIDWDFRNFTWVTELYLMKWNQYITLWELNFDRRVNKYYFNRCLYWDDDLNECKNWSQ